MSNRHEEQVPGVTLHFRKATAAGGTEGRHYEVMLDAWVVDDELWKEVQAKLEAGFRIFTAPDFHIEVMDVLRMELREAQERTVILERQLSQEKDAREQAQQAHDRLQSTLGSFGRALGR